MTFERLSRGIVRAAQVNAVGDVNIPAREEKASRKDVDRPAQRERDHRQFDESFAPPK